MRERIGGDGNGAGTARRSARDVERGQCLAAMKECDTPVVAIAVGATGVPEIAG